MADTERLINSIDGLPIQPSKQKSLQSVEISMSGVSLLEGNVTASVIQEVLNGLKERNVALTLIEILTILKTVIPVYPSLRRESKNLLLILISDNYNFMAQLASFTSSIPIKQVERKIYQQVIIDTMKNRCDCLRNYMSQSTDTKVQRNNLKALMFGSKLFNVLSSTIDIVDYLECLREQWKYVLERTEPLDAVYGELLTASFILHPTLAEDILLNGFFYTRESYFQSMITTVNTASSLDQQRLIKNFIIPHLDLHINESNTNSVINVLRQLPLDCNIDLSYILTLKSLILQSCIIRLLLTSSQNELVSHLLQRFGQPDDALDERICQLLVVSLKYANDPSLKANIGGDKNLLDGVTARLMHKDNLLRERTMYIAKVVTDGGLKYESDFIISIPEFEFPQNDFKIDFNSLRDQFQDIKSSTVLQTEVRKLSLMEDSDDEDDEENENERDIVFLKDLVARYARLDSNKKIRPLPLLKLTVKLVRQKKDFPIEVSYYSSELLVSISSLNNDLEEKDFEQWRINALCSIVVVTPETVTDLHKILFTSELSLQQRMSLLSSLGLSARELRGYADESIVKPQNNFPTSRLPWDKQTESHSTSAQLSSIEELPTERIVWKSKKLLTDGQEQLNANKFRKYSRLFFYPLAHGWLDGIDLGSFTDLFKTHYLMTLHIIYQCAYPVHDYDSMTRLMEQILLQASQQGIRF